MYLLYWIAFSRFGFRLHLLVYLRNHCSDMAGKAYKYTALLIAKMQNDIAYPEYFLADY